MKRLIIIIGGLLLFADLAIAQTVQNKDETPKIYSENGEEIAINRIGYTRIILKDGSIKKKCILTEIKQNWIVFKKDKVLHDMMIDKIKRIELEDETMAIYFDDKNKPLIKK